MKYLDKRMSVNNSGAVKIIKEIYLTSKEETRDLATILRSLVYVTLDHDEKSTKGTDCKNKMSSYQKTQLKGTSVKMRIKKTESTTEVRNLKPRPSLENYLLLFIVMTMATVQPSSGLTRGFYTMTSPMYRDAISVSAMQANYLLASHKVIHGTGESTAILLECTRVCLQLPGCKGFIHEPAAGRHTYELVKGSENPRNHVTCLDKCLGESGCSGCGRFHCRGPSCQDCKYTCWELKTHAIGEQSVLFTLTNSVKITCKMEWQLIWSGSSQWYHFLADFPLKLRVEIWYKEQDDPKNADYESITFVSGLLSVGKYTGGTAGDGWEAPFSKRIVSSPENSTCLPFFYSPGPCVANGLPDYETQLEAQNGTARNIAKSYYWFTEDQGLKQTIVQKIYLYVTRQ
ncbi:uncharacterized protein [Palaemon carinicauda]|uniref:uncharacterized protein n=1 Tax=Palaemon carinicauda TaxID=392227 RepID=UPI0035B62B2C